MSAAVVQDKGSEILGAILNIGRMKGAGIMAKDPLQEKIEWLDKQIEKLTAELDKAKQERGILVEAKRIITKGRPRLGTRQAPAKKPSQVVAESAAAAPKKRRVAKPRAPAKRKVPTGRPETCGAGRRQPPDGQLAAAIVQILRKKTPHWLRPGGIAEAMVATRLKREEEVDNKAISLACKALRSEKYRVPGLQCRSYGPSGKLFEYRIDSISLKDDE